MCFLQACLADFCFEGPKDTIYRVSIEIYRFSIKIYRFSTKIYRFSIKTYVFSTLERRDVVRVAGGGPGSVPEPSGSLGQPWRRLGRLLQEDRGFP